MKLDFSKSRKLPGDQESRGGELRKILLVDDEEVNLRGLQNLLKKKYEVLTANSGQEALEIFGREKNIKVVISDHIMPGMTGVELLSKLNEHNYNAVRILLTGFAALDNVIEAVNKGQIFRFLTKPLDIELFFQAVTDAVQIAEDRSINTHLLQEFKKIIYPHQIEKIERYFEIQDTMPVGETEAVVIAFDIQNSAKIGHSENHDFFETVLKKCHLVMLENYDKNTLQSNAYMIKEMGDGFICSVGFPFNTNQDPNIAAFELAHEFIKIFKDCAQTILNSSDVFCSLGLAKGKITGYFPRFGLKLYDLYGDAIIKATRYESLRKIFFSKMPDLKVEKANIITVHERVYDSLPKEVQETLHEYVLDEQTVRDDPSAKHVYMTLL